MKGNILSKEFLKAEVRLLFRLKGMEPVENEILKCALGVEMDDVLIFLLPWGWHPEQKWRSSLFSIIQQISGNFISLCLNLSHV